MLGKGGVRIVLVQGTDFTIQKPHPFHVFMLRPALVALIYINTLLCNSIVAFTTN